MDDAGAPGSAWCRSMTATRRRRATGWSPRAGFASLPGLVRRSAPRRRAGIWIAPLLLGRRSQTIREHPEWAVRDVATGGPVSAGRVVRQGARRLTSPDPGARPGTSAAFWPRCGNGGSTTSRPTSCYAGACRGGAGTTGQRVEAPAGLRLIRDAIGPARPWSAAARRSPSVGLVDVDAGQAGHRGQLTSRRAGPIAEPAQRNAVRNVTARAWQHGRFWINDADCLLARPGVERRAAWAGDASRGSAGSGASGDGLAELDAWGSRPRGG